VHVTTIKYQQSLLVLFGFTSEGVLDEWGVATNGLVTKALHFCHKMASAGKSGKVALLAGSVAAGAAALVYIYRKRLIRVHASKDEAARTAAAVDASPSSPKDSPGVRARRGFTLLCPTARVRLLITAQPLGLAQLALFVYAHVAMCVRSSPTHLAPVPSVQLAESDSLHFAPPALVLQTFLPPVTNAR
jgi:hypothetical protein